jgi:hypothetical protein
MWGLEPVLDQCKNLQFAGDEVPKASGFDLDLSSFTLLAGFVVV